VPSSCIQPHKQQQQQDATIKARAHTLVSELAQRAKEHNSVHPEPQDSSSPGHTPSLAVQHEEIHVNRRQTGHDAAAPPWALISPPEETPQGPAAAAAVAAAAAAAAAEAGVLSAMLPGEAEGTTHSGSSSSSGSAGAASGDGAALLAEVMLRAEASAAAAARGVAGAAESGLPSLNPGDGQHPSSSAPAPVTRREVPHPESSSGGRMRALYRISAQGAAAPRRGSPGRAGPPQPGGSHVSMKQLNRYFLGIDTSSEDEEPGRSRGGQAAARRDLQRPGLHPHGHVSVSRRVPVNPAAESRRPETPPLGSAIRVPSWSQILNAVGRLYSSSTGDSDGAGGPAAGAGPGSSSGSESSGGSVQLQGVVPGAAAAAAAGEQGSARPGNSRQQQGRGWDQQQGSGWDQQQAAAKQLGAPLQSEAGLPDGLLLGECEVCPEDCPAEPEPLL